jgi:hypothetical protein
VRPCAAALCLAIAVLAPRSPAAFRDAAIGDPVKNRRMPSLDGRTEPLLGSARANVVVFFRAGQDHSASALRQLAQLEAELAPKGVRFVGVVSSSDARDEVRAMVREAGTRMTVLVDEADALYGELGVSLHPSIAIVDARGRLAGYQPFRKLNLLDATRGRIQLALGEIGEAQLAVILDPPAAPVKANRAHARVKLARTLLQVGSVDAAVESARAGVALDPELADALARAGKCDEAEREAALARKLDGAVALAAACPRR